MHSARGWCIIFFMADYFDFEGREISLDDWYPLWRRKGKIADTTLDRTQNASGFSIQLSTIWTGRSWGLEEPPLIYETMAFSLDQPSRWDDIGCWRWATAADAAAGHERIVSCLVSGELILYESEDY
jgi:hypothetical protein